MPAIKPKRPTTAFRSPPPIRIAIRRGQPRKTSAPTITPKPSTKRSMGEEPPRGAKSFFSRAMANAPSTRPMISGRMYCTTAALCRPTPPAISRIKQAIQKPMFAGLPKKVSATARIPTTAPPPMSHFFSLMVKNLPFFRCGIPHSVNIMLKFWQGKVKLIFSMMAPLIPFADFVKAYRKNK